MARLVDGAARQIEDRLVHQVLDDERVADDLIAGSATGRVRRRRRERARVDRSFPPTRRVCDRRVQPTRRRERSARQPEHLALLHACLPLDGFAQVSSPPPRSQEPRSYRPRWRDENRRSRSAPQASFRNWECDDVISKTIQRLTLTLPGQVRSVTLETAPRRAEALEFLPLLFHHHYPEGGEKLEDEPRGLAPWLLYDSGPCCASSGVTGGFGGWAPCSFRRLNGKSVTRGGDDEHAQAGVGDGCRQTWPFKEPSLKARCLIRQTRR